MNFWMRDLEEDGSPLIAVKSAVTESAMNRAGEVGAEKGLPDARVWPSVEIITSCRGWDVVRHCCRAESRSEEDVGVPFTAVRFGLLNEERLVGSRARAVIV